MKRMPKHTTILLGIVVLMVACTNEGANTPKVDDVSPTVTTEPVQTDGENISTQAPAADNSTSGSGTNTYDANQDGLMTREELEQAVNDAYPTYSWPADYTVAPATILSRSSSGITGPDGTSHSPLYELDFEYVLLDEYNECAWLHAWADARSAGDADQEHAALDKLTPLIENSRSLAPYDQDRFLDWIQEARLGDPSSLMLFVNGGCADLPWD